MKLIKNLYFYPERGMMDCNTYVIRDKLSLLIDPGLNEFIPALLQDLQKEGIDPKTINIIMNTHLHGDHSWGNEAFKEASGAEILIPKIQKQMGEAATTEAAKFFGVPDSKFSEDRVLDEDRLSLGETEIELIPSPGHSPESVCYYLPKEKVLICGDVIFNQNTGRVDLPGGSADQLKQSIEQLSKLDVEYLLPGHMDIVTGADNVRRNFEFIKQNIFGYL
jgi:hydroxyacylglutathione hydrolase